MWPSCCTAYSNHLSVNLLPSELRLYCFAGPHAHTATCLQQPLGIDFGKARIGIATGQLGWLASPLRIVTTNKRLWTELAVELLGIAQQQSNIKPICNSYALLLMAASE